MRPCLNKIKQAKTKQTFTVIVHVVGKPGLHARKGERGRKFPFISSFFQKYFFILFIYCMCACVYACVCVLTHFTAVISWSRHVFCPFWTVCRSCLYSIMWILGWSSGPKSRAISPALCFPFYSCFLSLLQSLQKAWSIPCVPLRRAV